MMPQPAGHGSRPREQQGRQKQPLSCSRWCIGHFHKVTGCTQLIVVWQAELPHNLLLLSVSILLPQNRSIMPCTGLCFQRAAQGQFTTSSSRSVLIDINFSFFLRHDAFQGMAFTLSLPSTGEDAYGFCQDQSLTQPRCRVQRKSRDWYQQNSDSFQEGSSTLTIVQPLRTLPQAAVLFFIS